MAKADDTFVIGDVHGNYDRLTALLRKAGLADERLQRTELGRGTRIIQVGDLGHFGLTQDRENDMDCWSLVGSLIDAVAWGNHDRAVVDHRHVFQGYDAPLPTTREFMQTALREGALRFAYAAHGVLITHAGVAPAWEDMLPEDAAQAAVRLETLAREDKYETTFEPGGPVGAISRARGGSAKDGGILWRDDNSEDLSDRWPQIYGHSRRKNVRLEKESFANIDIGEKGQGGGRLAGIWLPSWTVVEVDTREDRP